MTAKKFRVGIVGMTPNLSWAANAHLPALRALSNDFEIAGVANTSKASGEAAAAATGLSRAFTNVSELVNSPDVDIVAVTVKVPHHFAIVKEAIAAGKHIFCEWPLGNGLAEAREMAAMARDKGIVGVVGTQVRMAPELLYLKHLVSDGYVGKVLSTTLVGTSGGWQSSVDERTTYLADIKNGATPLSIPVGHTLAGLQDVLGEIVEVSARLETRITSVEVVGTGKTIPKTSPDQVLIQGLLASGAPFSLHYRSGRPNGTGFLWEINGTAGDLQMTAAIGHTQMTPLTLNGARSDQQGLQPLSLPEPFASMSKLQGVDRNVELVYRLMANDIRTGSRTAPTFDDAVRLHDVLDAVERAAASGNRVAVSH